MNRAVILLGTNTGHLMENLDSARNKINEHCGRIEKSSLIYETEPWGKTDQDYFLNQVIEIETRFDAEELLHLLLNVESEMGRQRNEKWEPRVIDLDILYFNNDVFRKEGLKIPHPHLHERRFTLVPLAEILPGFIHPVLGKTSLDMLREVSDDSRVNILQDSDY
jgi:2-amino-4-hydroxy-6-hydroxymethyldihydropteridine diphosphokinase